MSDGPKVYAKMLAQAFIERAVARNYRGKKRDDAALDFFIGATNLAQFTGDAALTQHLKTILVLIIAVRGFKGVEELAA